MTQLLNEAKRRLDEELDAAQAAILARWEVYASEHKLAQKEAKDVDDTSAMIAWYVPADIGRQLVAGNKWPAGSSILEVDELHITIKYLGDVDLHTAQELTKYAQHIANDVRHFPLTIAGVGRFENVGDGSMDAVYMKVESPGIHALKARINADTDYIRVDDNPIYTPHITLAYVPHGADYTIAANPALQVTVCDISVSYGESQATFPFMSSVIFLPNVQKGGAGSGNFGHAGRPGKVGGSSTSWSGIVYHGSPNTNLAQVSASPGQRQYDNATSVFGAYFTKDVKEAERYATQSGKVYSTELHLDNPERMSWREFGYFQDITHDADRRSLPPNKWSARMSELIDEAVALKAELVAAGKDGIVITNNKGVDVEIVAFTDVALKEVYKQTPIHDDDKKHLIEASVQLFVTKSDDLADKLYNGDITLGQWQEEMKVLIKGAHVSVAAIAKGGWDNMGPRDTGRLGTPIREQYKYLAGFAQAIADNRDAITPQYIQNRARLYGIGIQQAAVMVEAGFYFEDNLPWLPKDGSTSCLMKCHCWWRLDVVEIHRNYRTVKATWHLGESDHCKAKNGKAGCIDRDGYEVHIDVPMDVKVPDKIGGY